ncbi:RHS repeat-associated core domain-containing protein [Frateuria defendens]|uniref:RHS repeat-associated core domain-containing protein n=1 Tax=Frateuria defendens TaxID=2219559 RepID=UPI0009E5D065|nr:RHS repeat-associated core domain-containing protein [Frateuria defendens]
MKKRLGLLVLPLLLMLGLAHAQSGKVTYVYTDPQGTPLAEADVNGNITATFDYKPYGSQALGSPPTGPGYTGHMNDPDAGLVYMQARYYDPSVGRFLSTDPVEPKAGDTFNFNRHAYVNNNPIKNIDPDGRNGVEAFGGLLYQSFQFIQGNGFDGESIAGALVDGYNGEGDGIVSAALDDISAATAVTGGVGLAKTAIQLATHQTGEKIISQLAKNAIKDDVKGNVRQIVKSGRHLERDASTAMKGGARLANHEAPRGQFELRSIVTELELA